MHALIFSAGWLCFSLGVIGVAVPILPTTPFMLLAATCFAKTSPRFHRWLLNSRLFGSLIRNWQEEKYIQTTTKVRALIIIALTFGLSIWLVDISSLKIMLACFWIICTFFVSRLSTVPLSQR